MNLFQVIATVAGVAMSFAYYPQAYRIWRRKSSLDIALANYGILGVGTAIWFFYGVTIKDIAMIISFGISVLGAWLVLILSIYFRKSADAQS